LGEETKETLIRQGNDDPLHATRKPSTADSIDESPAQVAEMPTAEEIEQRHPDAAKN
jgi:hypothetical protein